jgi:hypothetical protein
VVVRCRRGRSPPPDLGLGDQRPVGDFLFAELLVRVGQLRALGILAQSVERVIAQGGIL